MSPKISVILKNTASKVLPFLIAASAVGCQGDVSVNPANSGALDGPTPSPTAWLEGHLTVYPNEIDFGPVPIACPSISELTIRNEGQQPVEIFGIDLANNASPDFAVDYLRTTLQPFTSATIATLYHPSDTGSDEGAVLIESDAKDQQVIAVPMLGQDSSDGERLDRFVQKGGIETDFIWILDTSGSMGREIEQVVANFDTFMDNLKEVDVDYNMALITTDLHDIGYFLGTYGDDGLPWATLEMGDEAIELLKAEMIAQSRHSTGDEEGFASLMLALSDDYLDGAHKGFLREDARLVISVFGDEDDHSDLYVNDLLARFEKLKGADNTIFSAVVADRDMTCSEERGYKYLDIASQTNGFTEEVCSQNYTNLMDSLGTYGSALENTFPLEAVPIESYPLVVKVNDVKVEESMLTGWTYQADINSVVFSTQAIPPIGATIDVSYVQGSTCQ